MTVEKFANELFERCKFELMRLDAVHALNDGCHPSDTTKRYKSPHEALCPDP